ncbi:unnamed protein product [Paramecium octaurelia]|uniref:RING-type domain-containing protein n=1 Tax=Paramecium octaurelia TaxID=43137 RepID=A0A8S1TKD9_PAROT|nr:unnamed protein product [Paramecium octaurelia]
MSINSSNQKIKIISINYLPQSTMQQTPYQFNNDIKPPIQQYTQNSHSKFSVKLNSDLNTSEPNKQRSSSQLQNPLNPININLYNKHYERTFNKGYPNCQMLNQQNSDFAAQISEKPQQFNNYQSYEVQNVENNTYTNSQSYQNQTQVDNFVQNKGNNIINKNQQVYQQTITQQCPSNKYNNNNNFESYQPQIVLNTQCQHQNNNSYQVQNNKTENHTITQMGNQSITKFRLEQEEAKEYNSDNNCEINEDLSSSLIKSITYLCQHCNTRVSKDIVQLDCYHFYHIQCFQDHLLQQICVKTYRPLQCHCKIKISQSQVRNVLKLEQKRSDLIEKLLESEINSIFTMYKKIQNLNKCANCNFFWVGDGNDKTQKTYYCQKCERKYY